MGLDAVSCKQSELEDELEELEEDLLNSEVDPARREFNRRRVCIIEELLADPTAIRKLILDDGEDQSMDPIYFGDEAYQHRFATWEWVESGCPVWIAGTR